jgi:hypothetical protein
VVAGDGGREAYTTILWGGLLSRESQKFAEAETVSNVEGNMCGPALRGTDALPWSKTPSRRKGSRRNLGGPALDQRHPLVRIGKARSRSR